MTIKDCRTKDSSYMLKKHIKVCYFEVERVTFENYTMDFTKIDEFPHGDFLLDCVIVKPNCKKKLPVKVIDRDIVFINYNYVILEITDYPHSRLVRHVVINLNTLQWVKLDDWYPKISIYDTKIVLETEYGEYKKVCITDFQNLKWENIKDENQD